MRCFLFAPRLARSPRLCQGWPRSCSHRVPGLRVVADFVSKMIVPVPSEHSKLLLTTKHTRVGQMHNISDGSTHSFLSSGLTRRRFKSTKPRVCFVWLPFWFLFAFGTMHLPRRVAMMLFVVDDNVVLSRRITSYHTSMHTMP